jgi:hypothetical protein
MGADERASGAHGAPRSRRSPDQALSGPLHTPRGPLPRRAPRHERRHCPGRKRGAARCPSLPAGKRARATAGPRRRSSAVQEARGGAARRDQRLWCAVSSSSSRSQAPSAPAVSRRFRCSCRRSAGVERRSRLRACLAPARGSSSRTDGKRQIRGRWMALHRAWSVEMAREDAAERLGRAGRARATRLPADTRAIESAHARCGGPERARYDAPDHDIAGPVRRARWTGESSTP